MLALTEHKELKLTTRIKIHEIKRTDPLGDLVASDNLIRMNLLNCSRYMTFHCLQIANVILLMYSFGLLSLGVGDPCKEKT